MFYSFKTIFLVVGGGGGGWVVVVGGGGGGSDIKWVVPYTGKIFPVKRARGAYISVTIRFSIDSCVGS